MIDRPLVFGTDCPTIIISQAQISRLRDFFRARQVAFHEAPFQGSFEVIRFPAMSSEAVEELMDKAHPRD